MLGLWEEHKNLVFRAARTYSSVMPLEDLMQEGFIILVGAARAYDPGRSASFPDFAFTRVKNGLFRYVANNTHCIRIPEYMQRLIRKYKKAVQAVRRDEGRNPCREELITALCVDLDTLETIEAYQDIEDPTSLDKPVISYDDGESQTLADIIADTADTESEAIRAVESSEIRARILEVLHMIPEEEAAAVSAYYLEDKTMEEYGTEIGKTPEMCRQLKNKGVERMKTGRPCIKLRNILFDMDERYSRAYQGGGVAAFNRSWTSSTERAALYDIEDLNSSTELQRRCVL